jgi:hypothetical protein
MYVTRVVVASIPAGARSASANVTIAAAELARVDPDVRAVVGEGSLQSARDRVVLGAVRQEDVTHADLPRRLPTVAEVGRWSEEVHDSGGAGDVRGSSHAGEYGGGRPLP